MRFDKNQAGLALGTISAIFHFLWVLAVAAGLGQPLLDWTLSVHFIESLKTVTTVAFGTAVIGIAQAFISGYITGWVFAWLWNRFAK